MKQLINYFYNLKEFKIIYKNKDIYLKTKNEEYLFTEITNSEEILEIYNLLQNKHSFYHFIINKDHNIFTKYNNKIYVLLKINKLQNKTYKIEYIPVLFNKKYLIDRTSWIKLWSKKIDYFENNQEKIRNKYKIINESIDYYIGLAENAISYITYNISSNIINKPKIICHQRLSKENFYNPLYCRINYKEKDISEYLKYIFTNNTYKSKNIQQIILNLRCTKDDYILLLGALLFPTYYFDYLEKIVNNQIEESTLNKVITRNKEYESYLKQIYLIMNENKKIPKIDWF